MYRMFNDFSLSAVWKAGEVSEPDCAGDYLALAALKGGGKAGRRFRQGRIWGNAISQDAWGPAAIIAMGNRAMASICKVAWGSIRPVKSGVNGEEQFMEDSEERSDFYMRNGKIHVPYGDSGKESG